MNDSAFKPSEIISIHQWFKNGDHPTDYTKTHQGLENNEIVDFPPEVRKARGWEGDVVRYYRNPNIDGTSLCPHCGKTMHEHGWIDNNTELGYTVCPGDFIINTGKEYLPMKTTLYQFFLDKIK